ncbi:MAG: PAS domain-containing protein [Planctomycetes bacterium]|nr:PAS domain-containing protein [Planctomycetota bacterium]
MRTYKYVMSTITAIIACGITACGFCIAVGAQAAAIAGAVVALLSTAALAFCLFETHRSLRDMNNSLKSESPAGVTVRPYSILKPLESAFNSFVGERTEELAQIEKHDSGTALQLQLLVRQKKNIEAIIHSIRDSVIVTDEFDRVVLANSAAEKLFEFEFCAETPSPVDDLIDHDEFVEFLIRSRRGKIGHVRHELTLPHPTQPRTFDTIMSCIKDEKGVVSGAVAVLHDITREKEISQMKNDFVGHVSHELKTPLASINAYAEMLVDGEAQDVETANQFCSIIQTQAQRLSRLIDDILNISRIESGLMKIDKQPLSLAILLTDAAEMIRSYAAEKNITVNAQSPIIHDQTMADKDMITQVIINLLSNAVKYTPSGGRIDAGVEVDEAEDLVRVTVRDTGVGIPPEDVEYVFDKFYRVEENKKQAKGTGLGLNLVKQIVEKVHDGNVFVESTPGQGSTFGFTLPLAAKAAQTP